MPTIALVHCANMPEPDPDDRILLDAVNAQEGCTARWVAWDDESIDWSAFDLCVIRATWNYIHHLDAYLAWLDHCNAVSRLLNPAAIIKPNLHKGYLTDLQAQGIPTVPTELVTKASPRALDRILSERNWNKIVIKPAVGAGSYMARSFRLDTDTTKATNFLAQMTKERDALVQPFIESVKTHGERAVVWIDGEITHAVRKEPRFHDDIEKVSEALPVSKEESDIALRALESVAADILYARVDLVMLEDGSPAITELELIEPSLFLLQRPTALDRLASGIAQHARETVSSR